MIDRNMYTNKINVTKKFFQILLWNHSAQFLQLYSVSYICDTGFEDIKKSLWGDKKGMMIYMLKSCPKKTPQKHCQWHKPIICNITLSSLKYTQLKIKLCLHMQNQMQVLLIWLSSHFHCISGILFKAFQYLYSDSFW